MEDLRVGLKRGVYFADYARLDQVEDILFKPRIEVYVNVVMAEQEGTQSFPCIKQQCTRPSYLATQQRARILHQTRK